MGVKAELTGVSGSTGLRVSRQSRSLNDYGLQFLIASGARSNRKC
jgi:hypothetical protein